MKYWFVGDVHGKVDVVKKALALEGKKIFVGDFIDSWNRSVEDHDECYRLVIDAMKTEEPVRCIYGNHELSYLMEKTHRCSGYDYQRKILMQKWEGRIRRYFEPYIILAKDFLVTHAGLTNQIWMEEGLTLDTLPQFLAEGWPDESSPVHWIGKSRGGWKPCGGIFWCDFEQEFQPVPGLTQVFGHSRGNYIRQVETSFCIDCLDKKIEIFSMEVEEKQQ